MGREAWVRWSLFSRAAVQARFDVGERGSSLGRSLRGRPSDLCIVWSASLWPRCECSLRTHASRPMETSSSAEIPVSYTHLTLPTKA